MTPEPLPTIELVEAPAIELTLPDGRRDLALIVLTGVLAVAVLGSVVILAVHEVVDATAALGVIGTVAALGGVALGRLTGRAA